jgi:prevent-host-death family protein
MNTAAFEAKSKLSALLDRACSGEEVVITRHGTPIARLVPMNAPSAPDRARAVRAVQALNKRLNINASVSLRKLVEAGRD